MSLKTGRMTRGRLAFICSWLAIFAISFLVWALYLGAMTRSLEKYETLCPENAAAEVFDEYFATADVESILSLGELILSPYDRFGADQLHIGYLTEGKVITYYEAEAGEKEVRYEVAAGGTVFAEFTVIEDEGSKDTFGRRAWKLDSIKLTAEPLYSANIRAPKNATVRINGIELTDDDRVGDYITLDDEVYFPDDDPDARLMSVYRVEGLYVMPEVTVEENGVSYGIEFDRNESLYDTEYSYRTSLSEKYKESILG